MEKAYFSSATRPTSRSTVMKSLDIELYDQCESRDRFIEMPFEIISPRVFIECLEAISTWIVRDENESRYSRSHSRA